MVDQEKENRAKNFSDDFLKLPGYMALVQEQITSTGHKLSITIQVQKDMV